MSLRPKLLILASFLIVFCISEFVQADGFRNPPNTARTVGRISGYTPHIDEASAVSVNPANLVDLEKAQILQTFTFAYASGEFTSLLGAPKAKTSDEFTVLPSAYASWPIEEGKLAAGIGLSIPFGRFSKFGDDVSFKYSSPTYAKLGVVNLEPTIAKKFGERLSVGIGADLLYSILEFRQFYPWSSVAGVPGLPDGTTTFEGDGFGIGGSLGLTFQVSDRQRLALTYRSQFDIDYEGDFEVDNVPPPLAAAGITSKSDFEAEIKYPNQIALGYGIELTDTFRFGIEVEWQDTSRNENLPVDIANNNMLLPARVIPQLWDDHWTYGGGFDWKYAENWTLRGGLMYLETPVPSSTYIPIQTDDDQGAASIGIGYEDENHAIDISYMIGLFDGAREVRDNLNPLLNGDYDISSHFLTVSYRKNL